MTGGPVLPESKAVAFKAGEKEGLMNIEEIGRKVQYLIDLEEIKKLQRRYQYWLFKQDYEKIIEQCFARKTPGIHMEASDSGAFKEREGIKRFFRDVVGRLKTRPGGFTMHMAVGPVIEVAGDGKTAKGIWFSPGCAGNLWVWGVYMVDYVKEDDGWKFWHTIFTPFFRTPYEKGWMEIPAAGTLASGLEDGPPTHWNPYDKTKTGQELFHHLPEAPEPYETSDI
ncbi:MAG: hypothetical protein A2144_00810 [Chloroflexi bacterium RBG_16_50_9]|nr:MAG: hypothetical protein A2144_00810 [Chloroflexi bacterium RBG_16_50_9]